MAWSEPGSPGGKNKDPWGSRRRSASTGDLTQLIANLRDKLSGLFGGRGGGGGNGGGAAAGGIGAGLIAVVAVVLWLLSGTLVRWMHGAEDVRHA